MTQLCPFSATACRLWGRAWSSAAPLVLTLLLAMLNGCRAGANPQPPERHGDITGAWELDWMHGVGPVTPARAVTLVITAEGALSGRAPVNSYSGGLNAESLSRGTFDAGPLISTEMAGSPEAMRLEQDYFRFLDRADRFRIDERTTLVLSDSSGELLRFHAAK